MKKYLVLVAIIGVGVATLCSCGNSNKVEKYKDYRDAVKALNFEAAHDSMNTFHERYLEELSSIMSRSDRKEAEGKYYGAFDYIYKAEILYLLSELNGDEFIDKVTFLLEEIPVEGEKFPEGLCTFGIAMRGNDLAGVGIPLDAYIVWTQHFNRLCDYILSLAINRNNQDIAKMILLKYVDNVMATPGGDGVKVDGVKVDINHGYIKYTSEDRVAAQKKYDEAVKSGAFN